MSSDFYCGAGSHSRPGYAAGCGVSMEFMNDGIRQQDSFPPRNRHTWWPIFVATSNLDMIGFSTGCYKSIHLDSRSRFLSYGICDTKKKPRIDSEIVKEVKLVLKGFPKGGFILKKTGIFWDESVDLYFVVKRKICPRRWETISNGRHCCCCNSWDSSWNFLKVLTHNVLVAFCNNFYEK